MIKKLPVLFLVFLLAFPSFAAEAEEGAPQQVLTRGDAVKLLSATDFVKKKISELLSWTIGYDISKLSRVQLTPSINYVKVVPRRVPPDGRTIFDLLASVDDPGGPANIAGVRADLSALGGLPNMMLVDNGLFGDEKAGDGIYTLQTTIPLEVDVGQKEIQVAAANKKGWLALAKASLEIKKNPNLVEINVSPEEIKSDGEQIALLTVKIDNPGRIEDVRLISADLSALGYRDIMVLRNDGKEGDMVAGDSIFSLQFIVPRGLPRGAYPVKISASNFATGHAEAAVVLRVIN